MGNWTRINLSREELLDEIRKYKTKDASPNNIRWLVTKAFGNWSNGLKAAGLPPNKSGLAHKNPNKLAILYLVDFGDFKKYGVTQNTIKKRLKYHPPYTLLDFYETDLEGALALEALIKQNVKPYEGANLINGNSECFSGNAKKLIDLI